jgi:hypothetical protein
MSPKLMGQRPLTREARGPEAKAGASPAEPAG